MRFASYDTPGEKIARARRARELSATCGGCGKAVAKSNLAELKDGRRLCTVGATESERSCMDRLLEEVGL